jgi:hypothetical protein
VIDLGVGGGNEINLITDFEDDTDQIHLLFDGDPLGMARVGAIEEVAANSAPNNALNEDDTAAVTVLDGDIFDVLQFDAFFVPGLDSSDVLNVADVNQLALDVQAGGTDLFLV